MSKTGAKSKKLAIIDGKSVFYRGYYAMPSLSTNDGTPTGGVYGFAAMALELLKKLQPDYVCVAWDKPKTNIRKRLEIYPKYKAGRKPPPPDFYTQIPILHELLEAFSWPLYELDDYEADDIMGTLAMQAEKANIETMLITSDLDMLQCVSDKTHVYALKKGFSQIEQYHPESFEKKYGISVKQFIDLKSIKGDSSDNIPGVPGIGEKGAVQLLQTYKTLDGVYENIDLISGGLHTKLVAGKESAYLSKKLAAIWCDAPLKLDLQAMDVSDCDPVRVRDILQRLEFRSLVRQLPESMRVVGEADVHIQTKGLHLDVPKVTAINTDSELQKLVLDTKEPWLIGSRSSGAHGKGPRWFWVSPNPDAVYLLDLKKLSQNALKSSAVFAGKQPVVGYDLKATFQVLLELDVPLPPVDHDVFIGAFLINALRREQTLTELATASLNYQGADVDNLDDEQWPTRVADIAAIVRGLLRTQGEAMHEQAKLLSLASDIEWPVIHVLARMEYEGIQLDCDYLKSFNDELKDQISDVEQAIYGHANEEFNISSPAQLAVVLFEKLGLPTAGVKKGKTGYSTAATELDKLRDVHPIIDLISQYREFTKLQNTYVETLPLLVDENSRIHTTYNLTIAQTGRLSSTDPNLQNIPVRTDLGKRIRTAFVADKGSVLVSADYSQFELRLAAALADDKELIDMFNRDVDVHTATAAQVYGRDIEDVTKQMRRDAKVINFGILYGMSPHGLSVATGMNMLQAKHFIEKYFELRKPILAYMTHLKESARKDGYVETLFGRRRPMPDIHSSNYIVRQAAERAAINMPIQGTEADLMKLAMINVQKELDEFKSPQKPMILLQVHDSIVVECRQEDGEAVAKILKETMESVYELSVKLTVDTSIGKNWGEL